MDNLSIFLVFLIYYGNELQSSELSFVNIEAHFGSGI